jgi:hypothetical protein
METRRQKKTKEELLGDIAKAVAKGERTVIEVITSGTPAETTVAAEYFYVLRGIQGLGASRTLPPPPMIEDPGSFLNR